VRLHFDRRCPDATKDLFRLAATAAVTSAGVSLDEEQLPSPEDFAAARRRVRERQVEPFKETLTLTSLARLVRESTTEFEEYNYTKVLERSESFFWFFCDNYLELVKARRYGDHGEAAAGSANAALLAALSVLLRLFAPFLPFVTEEVWSWWQPGSIHRASWPAEQELLSVAGGEDDRGVVALDVAALVLGEVRKKKSELQRPMKTRASRIVITDTTERLALVDEVRVDLSSAALIDELETATGEYSVSVELASQDSVA
jgi:valyl-tRNA synthetase